MKGSTGSSGDAFVGYVYKISNNKLYVGLKYNLFFGFGERNGSFDIKIPCDTEAIEEIYLANEAEKKLIWPFMDGSNNPLSTST